MIYLSLLRGINVGGNKRIKMEKLRQCFEALGFERVQTFIQSGNVIFETNKVSPTTLSRKIESQLLDEFGFRVPVVIRTADELRNTIEDNPFPKEPRIDPEKLHVMFLSDRPSPDTIETLKQRPIAPDRFHVLRKEIYLYLPNGVAGSKLMKSPLDRTLSVVTTMRNWNTVNALHQMCRDYS